MAQRVTVDAIGCGFNSHSAEGIIILLFLFPRPDKKLKRAVVSATQHAMSRKFIRNWKTECLSNKFPACFGQDTT